MIRVLTSGKVQFCFDRGDDVTVSFINNGAVVHETDGNVSLNADRFAELLMARSHRVCPDNLGEFLDRFSALV